MYDEEFIISVLIYFNLFQVLHNHTLVYDIQYVPQEDSFRTTKKVKITTHLNVIILIVFILIDR